METKLLNCHACGGPAVSWYGDVPEEKRVQCGAPYNNCHMTRVSFTVDEWNRREATETLVNILKWAIPILRPVENAFAVNSKEALEFRGKIKEATQALALFTGKKEGV